MATVSTLQPHEDASTTFLALQLQYQQSAAREAASAPPALKRSRGTKRKAEEPAGTDRPSFHPQTVHRGTISTVLATSATAPSRKGRVAAASESGRDAFSHTPAAMPQLQSMQNLATPQHRQRDDPYGLMGNFFKKPRNQYSKPAVKVVIDLTSPIEDVSRTKTKVVEVVDLISPVEPTKTQENVAKPTVVDEAVGLISPGGSDGELEAALIAALEEEDE